MTSESAASMPSHSSRASGSTIAEPAIAASTCSHIPNFSAMRATASIGSNAVVVVVPLVATTAHGVKPRSRSCWIAANSARGCIAYFSSTAILRRCPRPKPASNAALSTELCACSEV
jgi:hypothetical protein